MADGLRLKCSKCNKEYGVSWGIGFSFPTVYKNTLKAAKTGEYGPEWQELTTKTKYVAIDAESYVYLCEKCRNWSSDPGLSLYVPKDTEELKNKYNLESVGELEERDYVMSYNLDEEYKILKRRIHKCKKCGGVMRKLKFKEVYHLPCPECGGAPLEGWENVSFINWD